MHEPTCKACSRTEELVEVAMDPVLAMHIENPAQTARLRRVTVVDFRDEGNVARDAAIVTAADGKVTVSPVKQSTYFICHQCSTILSKTVAEFFRRQRVMASQGM